MPNRVTKAVIPAAGLGTRFLPATIAQPKEMLPIVDKPVIQFVVEEAVRAGIKDILIVTGRSKRAIEDHFDPSFELESRLIKSKKNDLLETLNYISNLANIHFVRQKKQLGLADAIYHGKTFVGDEPFAVLLGDTIVHSPAKNHNLQAMIKLYEKTGKSVVAGAKTPMSEIHRYGVLDPKKITGQVIEVKDLVEKPTAAEAPSDMAIASRYVFGPEIFALIKKTKPGKGGEIQITDSMRFLAKKGQLLGYEISGKRYDIGNKVDFVKTNIDFALAREDCREEILGHIRSLISGSARRLRPEGLGSREE
jgi:UTP--glucose-1-phosphate uridylyltransferase